MMNILKCSKFNEKNVICGLHSDRLASRVKLGRVGLCRVLSGEARRQEARPPLRGLHESLFRDGQHTRVFLPSRLIIQHL